MATTERPSALSLVQLVDTFLEHHGNELYTAIKVVEQYAKLDAVETVKIAGMLLDVTELIPHTILHDLLRGLERVIVTKPSTGSMREAQLKALFDRSVSDLTLSIRSSNILTNANIHYIGELVRIQDADFLKFKGTSRKSLREVKEVLADMGLSLGMDVGDWKPPTVTSP